MTDDIDAPAPDWVGEQVEQYGPALTGYLAWLHEQGLLVPAGTDRDPDLRAGDTDRDHNELVAEFIATQVSDAAGATGYDQEFGDAVLVYSMFLDQVDLMLTDSSRVPEPGVHVRDYHAMVVAYFTDQAVSAAEKRAERCCSRC